MIWDFRKLLHFYNEIEKSKKNDKKVLTSDVNYISLLPFSRFAKYSS